MRKPQEIFFFQRTFLSGFYYLDGLIIGRKFTFQSNILAGLIIVGKLECSLCGAG